MLPLQSLGTGHHSFGFLLGEQVVSALFVGFAEYRYGAQSDHHGHAEEDLGVGTSRDLVNWATFDTGICMYVVVGAYRRDERGGESEVKVRINIRE